jgi:benzoyl-CoA reductase/2-hydroxyglutaryl-CoA dehydratase subunit BcrC/BadD/HgdB
MQTTEKNSEVIQVAPGVVVRRMGQLQRIDRRQRAYWIDAYAVFVGHLEWQPWTGKREALKQARKVARERKMKLQRER